MKSEDLMEVEIPPTEIPFPDGLVEMLDGLSISQIRRKVYVYLDISLLHRPDVDYEIDHHNLIIPHPIKTLDILTVAIPSMDERWYYSHADGWGRL